MFSPYLSAAVSPPLWNTAHQAIYPPLSFPPPLFSLVVCLSLPPSLCLLHHMLYYHWPNSHQLVALKASRNFLHPDGFLLLVNPISRSDRVTNGLRSAFHGDLSNP